MIVGFDHDDLSIFEVMPKFLADARISSALIGMLYAIPTTPLYDRLREAGRLNDEEAKGSLLTLSTAAPLDALASSFGLVIGAVGGRLQSVTIHYDNLAS
jgi:hypothetical protein